MSGLSEAEKRYRAKPATRHKRNEWQKAYNQRPEVKARDRERARRKRAEADGAKLNLARVDANRAKLGRAYLTALVAAESGLACREVPDHIVALKREQIALRRLAKELLAASTEAKEEA